MTIEQGLLFAFVVLVAACIEGIVGFGGNILALPFLTLFVDIKLAVPILMLVPIINAMLRMCSEYKNIHWPTFWKVVVMGLIGGVVGILIGSYMSETVLKLLLSIFMVFVAVKGLYEEISGKSIGKSNLQKALPLYIKFGHGILLFLSGFYNGAFACGGPFVAIYTTSVLKEKKYFRATMYSTVLATMSIMVIQKIMSGVYTGEVLFTAVLLLPALLIGYVISSIVQKKIDGKLFLKLVYGVILLAGFVMFGTSVAMLMS